MVDQLLSAFVAQGFAAILLFCLALYHVRVTKEKDARIEALQQQLADEYGKRVQDSKDNGATSRALQQEIMIAVSKLTDVQEAKELQRELLNAIHLVREVQASMVAGATGRNTPFRGTSQK